MREEALRVLRNGTSPAASADFAEHAARDVERLLRKLEDADNKSEAQAETIRAQSLALAGEARERERFEEGVRLVLVAQDAFPELRDWLANYSRRSEAILAVLSIRLFELFATISARIKLEEHEKKREEARVAERRAGDHEWNMTRMSKWTKAKVVEVAVELGIETEGKKRLQLAQEVSEAWLTKKTS